MRSLCCMRMEKKKDKDIRAVKKIERQKEYITWYVLFFNQVFDKWNSKKCH